MTIERNSQIDFLKFVGLSLIILAHVSPPGFLFQIRIADVPAMVFASGMAYYLTAIDVKSVRQYFCFLAKRVVRLLAPTWLFLAGYFLVWYFLIDSSYVSKSLVAGSFFLTGGIGYVWIIRVFILVAIFAPFCMVLLARLNVAYVLILSLGCLLVSEFWYIVFAEKTVYLKIFEAVFIYTSVYMICFAFGYLYQKRLSSREQICFVLFWVLLLVICVLMFVDEGGVDLQKHKYPPRTAYIAYAMVFIYVLLKINEFVVVSLPLCFDNFKSFVSRNTIWIYLWHIAMLDFWANQTWLVKYLLVYSFSVAVVYIQYKVVFYLCDLKSIKSRGYAENIKLVLIG